jgi:hypothetical protein
MMKNIYGIGWFVLVLAVLVSIFTGILTPLSAVVYSLMALGLVFTLMLWLVVVNTRETKAE